MKRNADAEEKNSSCKAPNSPNMASGPISHKEGKTAKQPENAVGQNVTTVINKTLSNTRNRKENYTEDLIYW